MKESQEKSTFQLIVERDRLERELKEIRQQLIDKENEIEVKRLLGKVLNKPTENPTN